MNYYFVKYRWKKSNSEEWIHSNCVMNIVPTIWLINLIKDLDNTNYYVIDYYNEISAYEYKELSDLIYCVNY